MRVKGNFSFYESLKHIHRIQYKFISYDPTSYLMKHIKNEKKGIIINYRRQ